MKILYVTQYFSQEPVHASTVTTYEIVKRLAQIGHTVYVISAFSPGTVRIYEGVNRCRSVGFSPIPEFAAKWYNGFTTLLTHTLFHVPLVITSMRLNNFCKGLDAIISMFHPTHMATVSAHLLSTVLRKPLVVKIHDFIIEATEPNMLKRTYNKVVGNLSLRILKKGNAILVQSSELMNVVKGQTGIDEKRMVIFPNGVDSRLFRPRINVEDLRRRLGLEGKSVVLFLGGLHEGRHPELLVKALPNIVREVKHARILFVGEGPDKSKLLSLANHLGVSDHVRFVGSVKHSMVPEFISLADVTVGPLTLVYHSTMYGSTPRTVSEYMACGKPVVVPRGAVSDSLVIDGYNGVLFEPGDVDGLASAVINLIEDKSLRDYIGHNARTHVEKIISWDVLIERLEKLLYSLANSAA